MQSCKASTSVRGMVRPVVLLGCVAAVAMASGCSSLAPDSSGAAGAAQSFHVATSSDDGGAACDRLSTRLRTELEESEGEPCERAILAADLPDARQVQDVQVWGGRALVVLDHDTLFVARFDGGWRVTAAGCTPRKDRPYDCTVKE
jgi:hypothetical protein